MKKTVAVLSIVLISICVVGGMAYRVLQAKNSQKAPEKTATVEKGDIIVAVVDSGTLDAAKVVELRSRVSGRLKRLLFDEGDSVNFGALVAEIDPQETQLKVEQDAASLRGAMSSVARTTIEIEQRKVTAQANYEQSKTRLAQLEQEMKAQPTLTSASITQTELSLTSARQERERLRTSVHPNSRTAVQSALKEAQANYDNAVRELDRQRELLTKGYVAERTVENAKLAADLARVRLDAAKDNSNRIESQLSLEASKADDDVRRAEAEVKRARANSIQDSSKRRDYESALQDVEKARVALKDVQALIQSRAQAQASVSQLQSVVGDSQRQLRETKLISPISGVVTKKFVQEGELVAALSGFSAGTSILRIEDRSKMLLKLSLNEIDVAKLREGMEARIDVDAFPDSTFTGRVSKIAPASLNLANPQATSSEAVVKYQVEIRLDKSDPRFRSGMSAKCTLEVIKRSGVLRLPIEFVGKEGNKRFIMLAPATKEGRPTRKEVRVGASTGALVEIVDGASVGQVVVKPTYTGPDRKSMIEFGTRD